MRWLDIIVAFVVMVATLDGIAFDHHQFYNPGWKRDLTLGKRDHQNFTQVPHGQLRNQLDNLCERYRTCYVEQEESYACSGQLFGWGGDSHVDINKSRSPASASSAV